jgi:hypothetical protein
MKTANYQVCRFVQMSLLNCLCAAIPTRERVVTCEEVFELCPVLSEVLSFSQPRRVATMFTRPLICPTIVTPAGLGGPLSPTDAGALGALKDLVLYHVT